MGPAGQDARQTEERVSARTSTLATLFRAATLSPTLTRLVHLYTIVSNWAARPAVLSQSGRTRAVTQPKRSTHQDTRPIFFQKPPVSPFLGNNSRHVLLPSTQ